MPRLSSKQYWKYHKTLRYLWLNHISVYGYLSRARQQQLHDFFRPSKNIAREELLVYRKRITAERPNLPHQAAWALKELQRVVDAPAKVPAELPRYSRDRKVVVRDIIRPEVDTTKLALAFWLMAKRKIKEEEDSDKH